MPWGGVLNRIFRRNICNKIFLQPLTIKTRLMYSEFIFELEFTNKYGWVHSIVFAQWGCCCQAKLDSNSDLSDLSSAECNCSSVCFTITCPLSSDVYSTFTHCQFMLCLFLCVWSCMQRYSTCDGHANLFWYSHFRHNTFSMIRSWHFFYTFFYCWWST